MVFHEDNEEQENGMVNDHACVTNTAQQTKIELPTLRNRERVVRITSDRTASCAPPALSALPQSSLASGALRGDSSSPPSPSPPQEACQIAFFSLPMRSLSRWSSSLPLLSLLLPSRQFPSLPSLALLASGWHSVCSHRTGFQSVCSEPPMQKDSCQRQEQLGPRVRREPRTMTPSWTKKHLLRWVLQLPFARYQDLLLVLRLVPSSPIHSRERIGLWYCPPPSFRVARVQLRCYIRSILPTVLLCAFYLGFLLLLICLLLLLFHFLEMLREARNQISLRSRGR